MIPTKHITPEAARAKTKALKAGRSQDAGYELRGGPDALVVVRGRERWPVYGEAEIESSWPREVKAACVVLLSEPRQRTSESMKARSEWGTVHG